MAAAADEWRQQSSLYNIITLNTNRRADLAGLPTLLRECKPDFVFLQEVNVSLERLQAAVSGQGYQTYLSSSDETKRVIAVLSIHKQITVADLIPGYLQKVVFGKIEFYHVHAPADSVRQNKIAYFKQLQNLVSLSFNKNLLPVIIGDFNSVTDSKDIQNENARYRIITCFKNYVEQNLFIDAYRVLHPATARFSWHRQNFAAARLDRVYLPRLLESRPSVARYIPTSSDHHAFFLKLDLAGLGLNRRDSATAANSFYWKFNSSLLKEKDFSPAFQDMWRQIKAELDTCHTSPSYWWENLAKPAISDFCRRFGRLVAGRRAATRRLYTRGLELALEKENWTAVAACKRRLVECDAVVAAGLAVRSGQPVAAEEVPGLYHSAVEGRHGPTPGLTAVKAADGQILREKEPVEQEILSYFETLFQGRHKTAADRPEPFDSGIPFTPDLDSAAPFLTGLPSLPPEQSTALEQPFLLSELEIAVESAAVSKSPGLDGLSYELYKVIFPLIGPSLLSALNHMMSCNTLEPSFRQGVVRLIPKVGGVPSAPQLRPITLLNTDYKLLTRMIVNRLLPSLPNLLQATQLCSVEGRSIFDGAAAVISASTFLNQHQLPGYLVSLDFFHAFDRVCLSWVDLVLEAMGFGQTFRRWVSLLHTDVTASFMLHVLSPEIPVTFSFRQGDPLALILFNIQIEPLLHRLQLLLHGLRFGGIREASLGYVDDVAALGSKESDLVTLDNVVSEYEAASGAILNRNRKSAILGLGSWAGRQDWPLQWIDAPPSIKLYGVHFAPDFQSTVQLSWDKTVGGLEATLAMWKIRNLPFLSQKRQVLHTFALSKLWYLAQILPLPKPFQKRILRAASGFLWKGRLERLAWTETESPQHKGGLGLVSLGARAEALLAKQACHRLAAGGRPRAHLSYWIGLRLLRHLPGLRKGLHTETTPPPFDDLANSLLRVFGLDFVRPENLKGVTSAALYKYFVKEPPPPPPKIQLKHPSFPWAKIWGRLSLASLPQSLFEAGFSYLHNILPTGERRHRLKLAASPECEYCHAPQDSILHAFTVCRRVSEAWENLVYVASCLLGGPVSDSDLLFLKFKISASELHIIFAVLTFARMVWDTRAEEAVLSPLAVRAELARAPSPFKSIFKLK